ncbi:uncharacterized protein LOC126660190 [Mercurialis annua]|uniref:uncharacterized protein LOC126660190 n=1 Tax=Mercurialis annua TaxID=3986 RepID=UPI0021605B3C|nr:uncharacterized protein LOC126660190 [Mercurialis annua]
MATEGLESSPVSPENIGVESAVAMEFLLSDEPMSFNTPATARVPRRIRKRLAEEANNKSPCTVEDIEAKLRLADLRRQQFYETLSSKARPKPRSPSRSSSSHEEDLGQRLEAKLHAAEQKRLSILENAQKRLSKLDELRQAAKTGVEMRYKRERERLGTKVELRVQQAEANRMLILKAKRQRRASLKERRSQSLLRRMARESKYKECVRTAMHQKRAAAERKRLGLLEEEKKRACSRLQQVRRVANSVSHHREIERRRMRDQLENRLQRAKRQRAEYLRQRGRQRNSVRVNWNQMQKQADLLSRKLARCWRQFIKSSRTTLDLAKDYEALKINESSVKSMPFEHLARLIESATTLQTVKALLDRLESRFRVSRIVGSNQPAKLDNIDHLLKRVATPKKRNSPRTSLRSRETKKVGSSRETSRSPVKLMRYPVRIVLCAYMILGHPDAVFSDQGEHEIALAKSAEDFIQQFELLMRIILDGPLHSSDEESDSLSPKRYTFKSQQVAFDRAWCTYLNCFAVWKVKDAQSLEGDLVRAACTLELSMIQKCKLTPEGESEALSHDLKAIQSQVTEDQKLLREKIHHLSGGAGIERMECALAETRSKYFHAQKNGSPTGSPVTHILSHSASSSPAAPPVDSPGDRDDMIEGTERSSRVVRSLFKDVALANEEVSSSATDSSHLDTQMGPAGRLITENELIVNEFLHERRHSFADRFNYDEEDGIKAKIRKTMEEAFWDGIMESIKQDEPSYDRVIALVREVRDGICEMAPESWKQEIAESIDFDILSQVLKSGNLDIGYLEKILDYALGTLRKLSSPAHEDELIAAHQSLLKELAKTCQTQDESQGSHAVAMIKGLRFVLEQIQALKQEISKVRIKLMEPLLKGPAGLDYLRKAFANRYGSHADAYTSLPLTNRWLSSVRNDKDQEWQEHVNCLSALMSHSDHGKSSQTFLPSTILRTGGRGMLRTNGSGIASSSASNSTDVDIGKPEPECNGEKIDLMVRLGLLKLVSGVSGLTQEALPETYMLNLPRLRATQAEMQKIIVTATSLLVCRQTLLMEQTMASSAADMESLLSKLTQQLLDGLDRSNDVGIEEIVEIISLSLQNGDKPVNVEKLQSRKLVMGRMLAKSLQAGDPVFEKVSKAVYLAARGVVLGGSGPRGKKLVETALRQVGAVMLTERVVETAEVVVVAAGISVAVHGAWYVNLVDKM